MKKKELDNDKSIYDYKKSLKKSPTSLIVSKIKFIDLYINRPLASLLVRLVYKTPITPNGLTYISFLIGIFGAFFFSRGQYRFFILGGICAQLASIIDGADGMLARAKNMCSEYGSHLDLFLDRITDFMLITGISVGAYRYSGDSNLLLLGFLSAGLYILQINLFYLTKKYLQEKRMGDTGEARALMILLMLFFGLINRLDLAIYILLVETVIVNLGRLFYFVHLGKKSVEQK